MSGLHDDFNMASTIFDAFDRGIIDETEARNLLGLKAREENKEASK